MNNNNNNNNNNIVNNPLFAEGLVEVKQEDIVASKRLFLGGFAFLPLLWLLNWIQYREVVTKPGCPESVKNYVKYSRNLFFVALLLWLVWLIVFYTNMNGWAKPLLLFEAGDDVL